MAETTETTDMVTIPAARLAELEALEAKITTTNTERFEYLRNKDKANPEKVRERVKRYKDKDRTAYNARRRELRRLKKAAAAAAVTTAVVNAPA